MQKNVLKPSKPGHVGIHWKALTEYSQMSTHVPGFQSSGSGPAANSRRILKLMLMGILVPEWLMVNPSNAKATLI